MASLGHTSSGGHPTSVRGFRLSLHLKWLPARARFFNSNLRAQIRQLVYSSIEVGQWSSGVSFAAPYLSITRPYHHPFIRHHPLPIRLTLVTTSTSSKAATVSSGSPICAMLSRNITCQCQPQTKRRMVNHGQSAESSVTDNSSVYLYSSVCHLGTWFLGQCQPQTNHREAGHRQSTEPPASSPDSADLNHRVPLVCDLAGKPFLHLVFFVPICRATVPHHTTLHAIRHYLPGLHAFRHYNESNFVC